MVRIGWKGLIETIRWRSIGKQLGMKSGRRLLEELLGNLLSSRRFLHLSVAIGNSTSVHASEGNVQNSFLRRLERKREQLYSRRSGSPPYQHACDFFWKEKMKGALLRAPRPPPCACSHEVPVVCIVLYSPGYCLIVFSLFYVYFENNMCKNNSTQIRCCTYQWFC